MPPPNGAAPPRSSGGGGGKIGQALSKKLGPLPAWGWGLLVTAAAYLRYRHKQSAGGSATAGTTSPASSTPPFIIQNYPLGGSGMNDTGQPVPRPEDESGKEPVKYVTKAGDTLETVARRFATDPGEILAATQEEHSGFAAELMRLISERGMGAKLPAGRVLYYVPGSAPGGKKRPGTGPARKDRKTKTGKR